MNDDEFTALVRDNSDIDKLVVALVTMPQDQKDRIWQSGVLRVAVEADDLSVVRLLLAAGAPPSDSALLAAVEGGNLSIVKLLLAAGVSPDTPVPIAGMPETTSLVTVACSLAVSPDTVSIATLLVNRSSAASLQRADATGSTALNWAANKAPGIVALLVLERLRRLLTDDTEFRAAINTQNNKLFTPIINACISKSQKLVTCLIDAGADKYLKNNFDKDAVYFARENGMSLAPGFEAESPSDPESQ